MSNHNSAEVIRAFEDATCDLMEKFNIKNIRIDIEGEFQDGTLLSDVFHMEANQDEPG